MKRLAFCATVVLSLAVAAACASSGSTTRQAGSTAHRGNSTLVTQEEIVETRTVNVYDAIQRLRPQWFTSSQARGARSDPVQVYLDSNRYGTIESLHGLSVGGVQEIRYLSASEATNRWGTGHTGGAILVVMSK